MYQIKTLDTLAEESLSRFGECYAVGPSINEPDALVVRSSKVDIVQYQNLKAVARAGAGTDNINVSEATKRGIPVFNAPGGNANSVAELLFTVLGIVARRLERVPALLHMGYTMTFGEQLSLQERIEHFNTFVKTGPPGTTGVQGASQISKGGCELAGKTIGVIGLGNIGAAVANSGIARQMKVVGFDPFYPTSAARLLHGNVSIVDELDELLTVSDIVTVHVPLCSSTRNLIGNTELSFVRRGCVLANYSRYGVYDEEAVLESVKSGAVSAYMTDFPHLTQKALYQTGRLFATPHLGASTRESLSRCTSYAVETLKEYLEYGNVVNSVNFPKVTLPRHGLAASRICVVNRDKPNMIAAISSVLGVSRYNIMAIAHESDGEIGYSLIDIDSTVADVTVQKIRELPGVIAVRTLHFS